MSHNFCLFDWAHGKPELGVNQEEESEEEEEEEEEEK